MARETLLIHQVEANQVYLGNPVQSFCKKCQVNSVCGYGLLQQFRTAGKKAPPATGISVPDAGEVFHNKRFAEVEIGDDTLIRLSAFLYLVPLSFMLMVLGALEVAGIAESLIIPAAFLSLAAGFYFVHYLGKKTGFFPVNVEAVSERGENIQ